MRSTLTAIGALAASATLAACGSSGSGTATTKPSGSGGSSSSGSSPASGYGSAGYGSSGGASSASGAGATIGTRHGSLGTFLVDAQGRSLYLFLKDKSMKSTCYGGCASVWPPVTTKGVPKPGAGVKASLLGTTKRTDGTTEVTYAGHPLYLYAGDQNPGDTKGEGLSQFGAKWYLVRPSGGKLDND